MLKDFFFPFFPSPFPEYLLSPFNHKNVVLHKGVICFIVQKGKELVTRSLGELNFGALLKLVAKLDVGLDCTGSFVGWFSKLIFNYVICGGWGMPYHASTLFPKR